MWIGVHRMGGMVGLEPGDGERRRDGVHKVLDVFLVPDIGTRGLVLPRPLDEGVEQFDDLAGRIGIGRCLPLGQGSLIGS